MTMRPNRRIGDRIVRRPRVREITAFVGQFTAQRHPSRLLNSSLLLFLGFGGLIVVGGLLLLLPAANNLNEVPRPEVAFFTATSAVTVTGLTVVNTGSYWSPLGQGIIFALMLVGGLGFMTFATFLLILIAQRITLPERIIMRDVVGVDRLSGLVQVIISIVFMVIAIYIAGTMAIWWRLLQYPDLFTAIEALWQSAFLSVSGFNNAGFSILPDSSSIEMFVGDFGLLAFMAALIILGGIGWTVLVDLYKRRRRFSRWTLDTKMVVTTSLFLWALGAGIFFLSEFNNPNTLGDLNIGEQGFHSLFHSISGRTAGFTAMDFSATNELAILFFPFLMFIGGATGSIAGGIKVATFAVVVAVVISSLRGRPQAEAFGRELPHFQVHRALTVAVLGLTAVLIVSLILAQTEKDIPDITFMRLAFETVSAFGTTGLSTGVAPQLSLTGKILFMGAMFIGRLGPITLALALTPKEDVGGYRFAQERVKIG